MDDKKKKFQFPHVYILLIVITAIMAIFTWIVPAGQYTMVEGPGGRMVPDPNSFEYISQTPIGFFELASSIPRGMVDSAFIIFFIFIIGGVFHVVNATGAIEAGLGRLAKSLGNAKLLMIPIMMTAFALCGATFGMSEETLPFIPILIALTLALKFDSITGVAVVSVGAAVGFTSGFLNPFTVGVAQGISELPLFSAMEFRIVIFVVMLTVSIIFVMRHALKVMKNPELSPVYELDKSRDNLLDLNDLQEFTGRRKLILLVLLGTIGMLIYGVMRLDWYIEELSALFLIMGFLAALIGGLGLNGFGSKLAEGMAGIAGGAIIVGFARAIVLVMSDGNILHTLLYVVSSGLSQVPAMASAAGMLVFQSLLNFLVPSGSGQAAVTMPIMAPLADLVGVTRQTAVIAFQMGDGISNIFSPTVGSFMAGLAIAKVQWNTWAKWFLPLLGLHYLLAVIFVIIAQAIQLGPF